MENNSILIYQSADGKIAVDTTYEAENLWLSQKLMATLFECTPENILIHIGRYHFTYYFSKMPHPASFIIYFQSFQTNVTHSTTVYVKKCPSSIRCRDSNPQLLGRKSPPITTRPGLLPITLLSSMRKKFIFLLGFSIIGN